MSQMMEYRIPLETVKYLGERGYLDIMLDRGYADLEAGRASANATMALTINAAIWQTVMRGIANLPTTDLAAIISGSGDEMRSRE